MRSVPALLALLILAPLAPDARAADDQGHVQVTRERVVNQTATPVYGFKVAQAYPHDRSSYTEGLQYENGTIYEGTGLYGRSKLRRWELRSGRVLNEITLDPRHFGEGVTVLGDAIYQLTYLANIGFVYDKDTFRHRGSFRYIGQGWGLTNDGRRLIMSDGSSAVLFVDPRSMEVEGRVFVTDSFGPVGFINELEYADGRLYANVWQTEFIAIIDPLTGRVTGWIDLTGLNPEPGVLVYPYVLNGIAYNTDTGRLLVTGKGWPHVYEIELVARALRR